VCEDSSVPRHPSKGESERSSYRARLTEGGLRNDRRREATLHAILAATRSAAASTGLGGLTAGAIAAEAGVTLGTFYNYFDSKEAALAEVMDRAGAAIRDRAAVVDADVDPALSLAHSIRVLTRALDEDPFIRELFVDVGVFDPARRSTYGAGLAHRIQAGLDAGVFHVDDPTVAMAAVAGAVTAAVLVWQRGFVDADPGEQLAGHALQILGLPRARAARIALSAEPSGTGRGSDRAGLART
jgi:AcrR family transcriptional regulator